MKILLPNVTLVLVETREHALARLALLDCLKRATPGEVLILTDKPTELKVPHHNVRYHKVPDWPEKIGWSRSWWYDVPPLLQTAYTLNIQWDSWICDQLMWTDEFYHYDYIGAPWWYKDGKNVGNGGFSFVSTALKRYLRANKDKFPCDTAVDDDLLCRKYRAALEDVGFRWAPERLAHRFAFECNRPSPTSQHFGFHGAFNFNEVLGPIELEERAKLMLESPTISHTAYIMEAFCKKNPALMQSLLKPTEKAAVTTGA